METPDLLKIVRRHYDDAPHGEGQYLHGSYFKPKHGDSLEFVLDEISKEYEDEILELKKENDFLAKDLENCTMEKLDLLKEGVE